MALAADTVVLLTAALSIFLFLVLCASLVLLVVSLRKPMTVPLVISAALVVLGLLVVAISPVHVPTLMGLILMLPGLAIGVVGGNPLTRRVLELAAGARVQETADGGIVLPVADGDDAPARTLMRGGTVIGYLERLAAMIAIIAGYPEAIAVVVAIKGIGRFSELAEPEARERFIVGTLASLVWACVVAAMLRLAI